MQESKNCGDCAHQKVCNYKYARADMEKTAAEWYDGETWPLYVGVRCQQFDRADKQGVAAPWFVGAPYQFKRVSSCGTTYDQAEPGDCKVTLKGGGEDGK